MIKRFYRIINRRTGRMVTQSLDATGASIYISILEKQNVFDYFAQGYDLVVDSEGKEIKS